MGATTTLFGSILAPFWEPKSEIVRVHFWLKFLIDFLRLLEPFWEPFWETLGANFGYFY